MAPKSSEVELRRRHLVPPGILFVCFLLSGLSGLLYQTVWTRLALARFGVNAPVVAAVLTAFMLGLALGNALAGRFAERIEARWGFERLQLYALTELAIGAGGLTVPWILDLGRRVLLAAGATGSVRYTAASALAIGIALVPFCAAMGATFPTALAYAKRLSGDARAPAFSMLYLANVAGALIGVLITSYVLIELLGFRGTLWIGIVINLVVASLALLGAPRPDRAPAQIQAPPDTPVSESGALVRLALFLTGFTSMGMEVAWLRLYTPHVGTFVYSFALILAAYLLATAVGAALWRRRLKSGAPSSPWSLWPSLAAASFLPLAATSVRFDLPGAARVALGIAPFCGLLGFVTPRLLDWEGGSDPRRVARAYGANLVGCVLGPLVAGFVLIPLTGNRTSLLLLAVPLFAFAAAPRVRAAVPVWTLTASAVAAALLWGTSKPYEDAFPGGRVLHDSTATVVAAGEGMQKVLLVNGYGITSLVPVTKMMAHFPLALSPRAGSRTRGLVICLGMGTTFRSLASWGADTTVVELVPSVPKVLSYFFPDAPQWLNPPDGSVRIVVDDGRRFLDRTTGTFDLITLDPPPPVEAAGSSLLYSEEFYSSAKRRLAPGGILQTWIPDGDPETLAAVTLALQRSFREVRVYGSVLGFGYHFTASEASLPHPSAREMVGNMPEAAVRDMVEWIPAPPEEYFGRMLDREVDPSRLLLPDVPGGGTALTDDRPVNEFFFVRRTLASRVRTPRPRP